MTRLEKFAHKYPMAIVLAPVILLLPVLLLLPESKAKETTITCTTNDSKSHYDQGWKKIETVDYYRIGELTGKGKAQVECKPGTLMCTAFIEGKAFPETKGCAWYWRKV